MSSRRGDQPPPEPPSLDDLRAGLPEAFRAAADSDVPMLWLAWHAALRGHNHEYLVTRIGVSRHVADQLLHLAKTFTSHRRHRPGIDLLGATSDP